METNAQQKVWNLNRPAYILFLLAGIGFLISKNFSQATIFFGLALVFDPFDTKMSFNKRPFWQQAWLIVHLSISFALFVLMLVGK